MQNKDNEKYQEKIIEISKNEKHLFCFAVALFIESQMEVFSQSPFPVQEVVTKLSMPIIQDEKTYFAKGLFHTKIEGNAQIYITLHLGNKPFVQVNYPELTILNWQNELEAGIALTIPQLLEYSIRNLGIPENLLLREIVRNEFYTWQMEKPEMGKSKTWSWLRRV